MKKSFWLQLSRICFFFFFIAIVEKTFATEPLHDQYVLGEKSGRIFPSECCWMSLPPSERLTAMKKAEVGCSAIGGPVGEFKLQSGKLWLTGLLTCGGEVSLRKVYPDFENPALANWLTGTFKTQVGFLCYDNSAEPIYSVKQVLTVEEGVVTSLSETKNDTSACSENTRR